MLADEIEKARQVAIADRVIGLLGHKLPEGRLLCFLDDVEGISIKQIIGAANRGFYAPAGVNGNLWEHWPERLRQHVLGEIDLNDFSKRDFDYVVYLHGSTCSNHVGLAMTLSHELQHFTQHIQQTKLRAESAAICEFVRQNDISLPGLEFFRIPVEYEARLVSKQVSEAIFGSEAVQIFVESKRERAIKADDLRDAADWAFIQALSASRRCDLEALTQEAFQKLRPHWPSLAAFIVTLEDPDLRNFDWDLRMEGTRS
jgi:hypothetical protein